MKNKRLYRLLNRHIEMFLRKSEQGQMKLWIDTDCGIDDSTAILICLACPHVEVVGISCAGGNAPLKNVIHNVNRTLKVWGHGAEKIPVYAGCPEAILHQSIFVPGIHGKDGLGDIDDSHFDYDLTDNLSPEHGVFALINAAKKYPDLCLLTLGPLTNLALAYRLDKEAINKLKSITIMGGTSDNVGNFSKWAEFNIRADPEAAEIVFRDIDNSKITVSSWTLTTKHRLTPEDVKRYTGKTDTTMQKWLHYTWQSMIRFNNNGTMTTADPIAAFVLCYGKDGGVTQWKRYKVSVILSGEQAGMTVAIPDETGVLYAMDIDHEMYMQTVEKLSLDH